MAGAHTIPEDPGPLIKTTVTVLRLAELPVTQELELEEHPGLDKLHELVDPHLDGARFEHVAVLHEGTGADMFIDEFGATRALERNEAATTIYRNAWLTQYPSAEPENLPAIYGPAVLFSRQVWF